MAKRPTKKQNNAFKKSLFEITRDYLSTKSQSLSLLFFIFISYYSFFGVENYIKDIFLIPFFYYSLREKQQFGFATIISFSFIKDILESSIFGVNILLLTLFNFFFHYQKAIHFNKKYYFQYTMAGITIYLIIKTIIALLIGIKFSIFSIIISLLLYAILYKPSIILIEFIEDTLNKK